MFAAAALLVGLGIAQAQTAQEHEAHHPDAAAPSQAAPAMPPPGGMAMDKMMGGDMASMMQRMHGGATGGAMRMMPTEHVEGRIAFLKTELKITDAQLPQWNAFADALRNSAGQMRQAMQGMHGGMPGSLPARLDAMVTMMSARLEGLKATSASAKSLYAVLDDAQKKTADDLILSPMGGM
jgi:hypothetical protein